MNLEIVDLDACSEVLNSVRAFITETKDLGTIMLHIIPGGFIAVLVDGRCVVAGTAADQIA